MKKLLINAKKSIALVMAAALFIQSAGFSRNTYADEQPTANGYEEQIWSGETTDEVLDMVEHGLNLETFFQGDLTRGTTAEELIEWKNEGKDINDVVLERARERSAILGNSRNRNTEVIDNRDGTYTASYSMKRYLASPDADGKYYLTEVTSYHGNDITAASLYNPKTNVSGASTPWYIELGYQTALCCTFGADASVRTDHYYVSSSINTLRENQYFRGGSTYPVEGYLRGAAYAYERIGAMAGITGRTFTTGALDADLQETDRRLTAIGFPGFAAGMNKEQLYSVFQIITWQVACGTFNGDNLSACEQTAVDIFGQLYPAESYANNFGVAMTYIYDYFATCAMECASGNYEQKFSRTSVQYWSVQGSDTANWQDFITWDISTPTVPSDEFKVTKYGKVLFSENFRYPNATFYIYTDSGCTNKIGQFTTDSNGEAKINIVEGIYYLKEQTAPAGTIKNEATITLTVDDRIVSADVTNDEIYNGLILCKYNSLTNEVVPDKAKFALYEYVNGNYMKLCDLTYTETGFTTASGMTVPKYAYYIAGGTTFSYHAANGSVAKTMTGSSFYYTPVNGGRFKVVEENAPSGYSVNTAGKTFTMNTSTQGYIWNFTSVSSGIKDVPYNAGIKIAKNDSLTEDSLEGAEFKVQEKINDTWYDVGKLEYDSTAKIYMTSSNQNYVYRNSEGSIRFNKKDTEYPLVKTTANNGKFRIVETKLPSEGYAEKYIKEFTVSPSTDNYMYDYTSFAKSAKNTGKAISVKTAKYDALTGEQLAHEDIATITVYEYNTVTNEWQELGNLKYNSETKLYETSNTVYTPHKKDGSRTSASIGQSYLPGRLYYTSVNQGKFKVVETINPDNYMLGILNPETLMTTAYEKEFVIDEDTENEQVIDLTDIDNAAKDTGISANIELSKYDGITKERITTGDVQFTVSEKINGTWYQVGTLVYDATYKTYKTKGMALTLHNSAGNAVYNETSAYGLYYTTANQGNYKVEEKKAPDKYILGAEPYVKEFNITTDATGGVLNLTAFDNAAKDIGIRGKININKYDAATQQIVRTGDTVITVYEYISDEWYEMGTLKYDSSKKQYSTSGTGFQYHDSLGREVSTDSTSDYETGWIYYTTANKGRFKIVETAAPSFYTLTHSSLARYEKEITLTKNSQEFIYTDFLEAIRNFGIKVVLNVNKYDIMTKSLTLQKNTKFVVQEYVSDKSEWLDVAEMVYDSEKDLYTTKNVIAGFHDEEGNIRFTNSEGKLYYTTQNLGMFRVVEKSAPTYYTNGTVIYVKEFNITRYPDNGTVDLTALNNSAQNLGISGTVDVVKYDRVTSETVKTTDAVFTVSEKINGKWYKAGTLKYDAASKAYTCAGTSFTFHNEDGSVINTDGIADFQSGKLYYTTANRGQFKVAETTPPTYYTNDPFTGKERDIFEKEFVIDEAGEVNSYSTIEDAAKNAGIFTKVSLLKYDYMTGKNVKFNNAVFTIEEKVNGAWLTVGTMKFDSSLRVYTTSDTAITLHNSEGKAVYKMTDGKLYYTTANAGKYRVRESSAPKNYILGRQPYIHEFNVTESNNNLIDLTQKVKAANNLGYHATVEALKFDDITKEQVRTNDTEFTVYEYIAGIDKWLAAGKLVYNQSSNKYDCTGVSFTFHNEDGSIIDTSGIPDFETGRLYYTTANDGKYKIVETTAPENYTPGDFCREFEINAKNGETFTFLTTDDGALNTGISVPVEIRKYDILTGKTAESKDTVFEIQEYIKDCEEWLPVGILVYDAGNDVYSTRGMEEIIYHNSEGNEIYTTSGDNVTYTSANLGLFRVIEKSAPTYYTNNEVQYVKEFDITTDAVVRENVEELIDITDISIAATNLGQAGIVKISKFDTITGEKVLTGDAEFTIYEYIDELEDWIRVGTLSYSDTDMEYVCEDSEFIFHDEEGNEIDADEAGIEGFETGKLYYTTANNGKFKVVETKAPEHYLIDGYDKEFNITENEITELTSAASGAYDTGVRGKVSLIKADSITDKKISGALFAVQEWSENNNAWLTVGYLKDNGDGTYTTDGINVLLHTGIDSETVETQVLHYTTQNLGRYRIIEVEAPKGYINDMYVSDTLNIDEDLKEIELTSDDLKATDTPIRVGISKTSVTDGKMIIGATLTVKDKDGKIVDTWITDGKEHIISAIQAGKYTLIEERAAEGYIIASSVEFEVTETSEIQKVTMVDEEVKGQIVIEKSDGVTGQKLSRAKFEIRDEDGNVIETLITDENGHAESKLIAFGIYDKNGTYKGSKKYTIIEIQAPDGYNIDSTPTEVSFEYKDDKTPVVVRTFELNNNRPPKTGDSTDITIIMIILFAAIVIFGTCVYCRGKETSLTENL